MSVPSLVKLAPNMDTNTLANALNTNFNQIQAESRRKTISDENGEDRIIMGKQDDGSYNINVYEDGDLLFTTANKNKFLIRGPYSPTLTYTANSGSVDWDSGDTPPAPVIPFDENPDTPSMSAFLTDIDGGWGNTRYQLPYIETDSSGNVILKIDLFIVNGTSYWAPVIKVSIPSSSSYYGSNHTFSFVVRVFNT